MNADFCFRLELQCVVRYVAVSLNDALRSLLLF